MTGKKDREFIGFRATPENALFVKGQKNQQDYLNWVIEQIRNGDLVTKKTVETNKELDLAIKTARLHNLRLDAAIKQRKLEYFDTFGAPPSTQAERAIRAGLVESGGGMVSTFGNDERPQYVPSQPKRALISHFCEVDKKEVALDPYKFVFCPKCGATV